MSIGSLSIGDSFYGSPSDLALDEKRTTVLGEKEKLSLERTTMLNLRSGLLSALPSINKPIFSASFLSDVYDAKMLTPAIRQSYQDKTDEYEQSLIDERDALIAEKEALEQVETDDEIDSNETTEILDLDSEDSAITENLDIVA